MGRMIAEICHCIRRDGNSVVKISYLMEIGT